MSALEVRCMGVVGLNMRLVGGTHHCISIACIPAMHEYSHSKLLEQPFGNFPKPWKLFYTEKEKFGNFLTYFPLWKRLEAKKFGNFSLWKSLEIKV